MKAPMNEGKELYRNISTRANFLSNRYYFLDKEDLIQDGIILVMSMEGTDLTHKQKCKAINNMYSNVERHARYQVKLERNMSSFDLPVDAPTFDPTPEEEVSMEEITDHLFSKLSRKEVMIVDWLSSGETLDEIAEKLNITRNRLRVLINRIIKKRKELEDGTDS